MGYGNTDLTFRITLLKCQQKWTDMIVLISPIILKGKRVVFHQKYSLGLQNQQFRGKQFKSGVNIDEFFWPTNLGLAIAEWNVYAKCGEQNKNGPHNSDVNIVISFGKPFKLYSGDQDQFIFCDTGSGSLVI